MKRVACVILLSLTLLIVGCAPVTTTNLEEMLDNTEYIITYEGTAYYVKEYVSVNCNVEFQEFYVEEYTGSLFETEVTFAHYLNYRLLSGDFSILGLTEDDKEKFREKYDK